MRIDVHAHCFPLEYLDRLDLYGASQVTGIIRKMKPDSADFSGLEAHFRTMDDSKVDLQILSVSGQLPYFAKENDAVDAARLGNDREAVPTSRFMRRPNPNSAASSPWLDSNE